MKMIIIMDFGGLMDYGGEIKKKGGALPPPEDWATYWERGGRIEGIRVKAGYYNPPCGKASAKKAALDCHALAESRKRMKGLTWLKDINRSLIYSVLYMTFTN